MTKSGRPTMIHFLLLGILVLVTSAAAQTRPAAIEKIAKAYGLDSWGQVEAIRYTWSGEVPNIFKVSHTWEWEPKTGKVTFETTDKDGKPVKVSYVRSQLNTAPAQVKEQVEPAFVNDNYWLLFPLHAYWDTSAAVEDKGMQKLPIGKGTARLVSVKYPAEAGGYTPGDTWDLYVGKDNRVVAFTYHRGGDKKPKMVTTTWAGNKMAGPLLISTEHHGTTDIGPFNLTISNVAVKLTGSDTWVDAK